SGGNWRFLGNTLSMAMILKNFGLTLSKELNVVVIPKNFGGASMISCGAAVPPPRAVFDEVGIDLEEEALEARKEMNVDVLPDELVGRTNLRLLDAANDLGYHWTKTEKFIRADRCVPDCADCMLGCPRQAKWTAREYGEEAVRNGADLLLHTRVTDVIRENGRAVGVRTSSFGTKQQFFGKRIVLSGGTSNVGILRRAGIDEAGRSFAVDFLQFVGGVIPGMNTTHEQPMAVGTMEHYESDGIIILPVFPNWAMQSIMALLKGPRYLPRMRDAFRFTGIMVKIRDELRGEIYPDNPIFPFSKAPTERDKKRLDKGVEIIRKVLKKAGASEDSIIAYNPSGAHPSASCRIGVVVDKNLETRIQNLYCCDASVLPSSMGLPVVWTAVSLGKRLAKHLDRSIQ
ncbi:MAG: GMC family oxidoreductase N-terminal domain-containing protein, partial [Desulfobacterota bacterium]|nr:GMC family oxidoreductase N-terminal domain-containing protein [Thermodesulfobacteriota bacterium]